MGKALGSTDSQSSGQIGSIRITATCQSAKGTHAFNPSTPKAEAADLCEFEAILIYMVSSRSSQGYIERGPVSVKQNKDFGP